MTRRGLGKLLALVRNASMRGGDGNPQDELDGWSFWKRQNGIVVSRQKDPDGSTIVRGYGVIQAPVAEVYKTIADVSLRPRWDTMTVAASVLESISEEASIVQYVMESTSPFVKDSRKLGSHPTCYTVFSSSIPALYDVLRCGQLNCYQNDVSRDILCLQSQVVEVNGANTYAVFGQSIHRDDLPQSSSSVRGQIPLTGFYMRAAPRSPGQTELVYVLQMDGKGVFPSWASNLVKWRQAMCVEGVKQYVESRMAPSDM